jgi:hypothetical protein
MKKAFLFVFFMAASASIFAASGSSIATSITTFYTSYVRPILIAWVVIQAAISGVLMNNKVRKGDEESSDAMMGWFKMIIWPIVVLGVAELGTALYS